MTGASRGIGRGIARSLATQGYGITITSRADADLVEVAEELRSLGAPLVVHRATDLAARDELPGLVALHAETFGSMDALVINAGIGTAGPVASTRLDRFDKTVEVNLASGLVLVQAALPLLRTAADADPSRASRVIALSSITGVYAEAGLAVYGATKAALISLMETINLEESGHGVCATAVAPGYVETDMSAWTTDTIPAEKMIRVDDVVAVVDMLLELGRNTSITKIVMTRSGASSYGA
ncbi:SDR family NAD(P)-dependent oxidoreductase [Nocardioides sp. WS12]|uniref:SDR family NAD(P)-dependent oxidoreductase n=1 Tax=Nocardioides sp. WS12 TaxID=2486272 RepID=UPI00191F1DC9|nr:SDR family NAD(P)-dependent oxidoreductase [Nocardioides sp. WS12]